LSIATAGEFTLCSLGDGLGVLMVCSVRDFVFTTEKRRESEEILDQLDVPFQINLISDVEHGFAVRCDMSESRQKFAKE
jgi:hypothetical protein